MDNRLIAAAITKAIAYNEQGGKPSLDNPAQGKSGEMKSIFQYTPATWKHVSQQVYGKEVPMTADTETYATLERVKGWLDKGYKPSQIFSMWNAGEGEPDAYTGKFGSNTGTHRAGEPSSGVNSYGVKYDVASYTKRGLEHAKRFYVELASQGGASQTGASQIGQEKAPANGGQSPIQPPIQSPTQSPIPPSSSPSMNPIGASPMPRTGTTRG